MAADADADADALGLVDKLALATYLSEAVGLEGAIEVELLAGGRSNLTHLVAAGGQEYVVRRRPVGPLPAGAHDMAREHRVLEALAGSGLPVPPVYGYCGRDDVVGAPFDRGRR